MRVLRAGPNTGQPQLWVGAPGNVTADGNVTPEGAYGVNWASTASGSFSIQDGRGTSGYPWGGFVPYSSECHANPQVFPGSACYDGGNGTGAAYAPRFAAAARQLRTAFQFGKRLGFTFALGNEVPVLVPAPATGATGATGASASARENVYAGIFTWLERTGLAPLLARAAPRTRPALCGAH